MNRPSPLGLLLLVLLGVAAFGLITLIRSNPTIRSPELGHHREQRDATEEPSLPADPTRLPLQGEDSAPPFRKAVLEHRPNGVTPSVSMELLDPSGTPLVDWGLTVTLFANGEDAYTPRSTRRRTNEFGKLQIDDLGPIEEWQSLLIGLSGKLPRSGIAHMSWVHAPWPIKPGLNAAEPVHLGALPVLASGRVVDAQAAGTSASVTAVLAYGGSPVHYPFEGSTIKTGEHGRFLFEGHVMPRVTALVAQAEGLATSPPVFFTPPANDVLIRLHAIGGLEGSLSTRYTGGMHLFEVRVERVQEEYSNAGTTLPTRDGSFRFENLISGPYDLVISNLAGDYGPVLRIEGLVVPPNGVCRDPRIQHLELPEVAPLWSLNVLDPQGAPVPHGYAKWVEEGIGFPIIDGVAVVYATAPTMDFEVGAPGYQPTLLTSVRGDRSVHLEPGIELLVRLPMSVELDPSRGILGLSLSSPEVGMKNPEGRRFLESPYVFSEDISLEVEQVPLVGYRAKPLEDLRFDPETRLMRLAVPEANWYRLQWTGTKDLPHGPEVFWFPERKLTTIEIGPETTGPILIAPPLEAYKAWLESPTGEY